MLKSGTIFPFTPISNEKKEFKYFFQKKNKKHFVKVYLESCKYFVLSEYTEIQNPSRQI